MAEDVIKLFEEYAARLARGEEPDARDYLDRAGGGSDKLAALIEEYLLTMPVSEPSEEQVAVLEAWLRGETPLLELRRRHGLKRPAVVARLVELLALEPRRSEKVAEYYHELESGLLDTRRVDERVFAALAEILTVPADLLGWRPPPRTAAEGAYFRIDRSAAEEARPAHPPARPAPEEWDEVDRLFRGDPPEL